MFGSDVHACLLMSCSGTESWVTVGSKHFPGKTETELATVHQASQDMLHTLKNIKCRLTYKLAQAYTQLTCTHFLPVAGMICSCILCSAKLIEIHWLEHFLDRICGFKLIHFAGIKYHILCHGVNSQSLCWVMCTWEILQHNPNPQH